MYILFFDFNIYSVLCCMKYHVMQVCTVLKYPYFQITLCGVAHSLCRSILSNLCLYTLQSIAGCCEKYDNR